jgi:1-acyl-sn-glycerol-3-phosphate acyltransferase
MAAERIGAAVNRGWRILATGISFASFGLGGVVLWAIVLPWVRWRFRNDPERRRQCARRLVQRCFAIFIELMRSLGVLTYEFHGEAKLRRPGLLVLANHPTLIDVVFLISRLPNADCVVRAGLFSNPFTRGALRATDYLSNDGGPELVERCIRSVQAGSALVIFPEGTRTRPGKLPELQRGAANIAVRGRIDLTPVTIHCDPPTLGKGLPWYRVPTRRFHVTIRVHDDISITSLLAPGRGEAAQARDVTDWLRRFFFEGRADGDTGQGDQELDHRVSGTGRHQG